MRLHATHGVREAGRMHELLMWQGQRPEAGLPGGFDTDVTVLAVFRAGVWFIQDITGHETEQFEFGFPDSQPVPADYDGDGTTDYAVYRNGTWYIYDSGKPRFRTLSFGREGEVPLNELSVKPSLVAVR